MVNDPIGALISRKRRTLGLTLRDLAARAGIASPSFVLYIENGRRVPSPDVARRLAEALEDDPDLYEAWAHLLGRTSPAAALGAARLILSDTGDRPIRVITLEPTGEATLRVSAIPAGSDPGPSLHPEGTVIETLRVPWSGLPPPEHVVRPYASPLEGDFVSRVPDLSGRGYGLFVRDAAPPAPYDFLAVRTRAGIRLARVLWNGTALLLLPAAGADDFDVLPAIGSKGLEYWNAGRLIRILVR
jgi:transcriptional regulator with XRE-family HTH domain